MVVTSLSYANILLVLLVAYCRGQSGQNISITIGNNSRSVAIVPDEVEFVMVIGNDANNDNFTVNSTEPDTEHECSMNYCTIDLTSLTDDTSELEITLTNGTGLNQTLRLTIRESLDVACMQYSVPQRYSSDRRRPYTFTCEPGLEYRELRWRQFRERSALEMFLANATGFNGTDGAIISGEENVFTLEDRNQTLIISSTDPADPADPVDQADILFYYVPSFITESGQEQVTAETYIFLGPELTREDPEFSIDVVLKSDRARFYNGILCEAESFPPATATWLLTSEDHPNGTDVATLTDKFNLANSGEGMTFTFNATVEMRNLSFEDDGIFTCTVGNGVGEIVTRSFRLRVKSNLRPVWPLLGIIGVFVLVSLSMLCHACVDKVVEAKQKKRFKNSLSSSPNHTSDGQRLSSVSSTSGQSNNKGRKHGAVKRLASNRPLIEEKPLPPRHSNLSSKVSPFGSNKLPARSQPGEPKVAQSGDIRAAFFGSQEQHGKAS